MKNINSVASNCPALNLFIWFDMALQNINKIFNSALNY